MMKHSPSCEFDNEKIPFRMKLSLPCDIDAIEPVVHQVMEAVSETNCVPGSHFEVDLALREALANAVIHGCAKDAKKEVQVCVACAESYGILIVIRDPGAGFDPNSIPSPVESQSIHSSHGCGIFLINQLMDEVQFGSGGSEIRMRKK